MLTALKSFYFVLAYWFAWAVFGGVGLLLNLLFLPLLLLPRTEGCARFVRDLLGRLFRTYLSFCAGTQTMHVRWQNLDQTLTPKTIYIANHPTLLDAPILLTRLPDAICVFKPRLMRNPAIGPVALLAGYVSGGGGVDAVRETAARVMAGRSLLIFPEGTRTAPGTVVGPLQAGFALIAARAHAPVQLVIIRATEGLTTRGRAWWKMPASMPARVQVRLDRRWEDPASMSAMQLSREVESRMHEVLSNPPASGASGT